MVSAKNGIFDKWADSYMTHTRTQSTREKRHTKARKQDDKRNEVILRKKRTSSHLNHFGLLEESTQGWNANGNFSLNHSPLFVVLYSNEKHPWSNFGSHGILETAAIGAPAGGPPSSDTCEKRVSISAFGKAMGIFTPGLVAETGCHG
jgi:hypothetical protein